MSTNYAIRGRPYVEHEDMYNQKHVYKSSIQSIHDTVRSVNENVVINHIFDRGHDRSEERRVGKEC